jgi:hypothetical protein
VAIPLVIGLITFAELVAIGATAPDSAAGGGDHHTPRKSFDPLDRLPACAETYCCGRNCCGDLSRDADAAASWLLDANDCAARLAISGEINPLVEHEADLMVDAINTMAQLLARDAAANERTTIGERLAIRVISDSHLPVRVIRRTH